jgi:hypothetical protein
MAAKRLTIKPYKRRARGTSAFCPPPPGSTLAKRGKKAGTKKAGTKKAGTKKAGTKKAGTKK